MNALAQEKVKVRLATTSLAGCFGCHMSFLDIDERILELMEIAEFDRSPLTDIKHCGPCDIALVEGGVCNSDNVHVVRELRANAKILVGVGACAINGGLPALRNRLNIDDILTRVYRDPVTDEPCVPELARVAARARQGLSPERDRPRRLQPAGMSAVGRRDLEISHRPDPRTDAPPRAKPAALRLRRPPC